MSLPPGSLHDSKARFYPHVIYLVSNLYFPFPAPAHLCPSCFLLGVQTASTVWCAVQIQAFVIEFLHKPMLLSWVQMTFYLSEKENILEDKFILQFTRSPKVAMHSLHVLMTFQMSVLESPEPDHSKC